VENPISGAPDYCLKRHKNRHYARLREGDRVRRHLQTEKRKRVC
jgi:hypothetical protein